MIHMAGTFAIPYYAVIFISMKDTDNSAFDEMQNKIVANLHGRKGLLGMDRCRTSEGLGFSISYWDSMESINAWRNEPVHAIAQHDARKEWYSEYVIRTCKVEYDNFFSRTSSSS